MTKQQVYKKHARYLGRKLKKDRDFSKVLLTIGFPTKNQLRSETFKKLSTSNE